MLRGVSLLLLIMLLSGCSTISTLNKIAKVVMDPGIQVGSDKDQPSQVGFSLVAEPDINPNDSDEATPVTFQIVMLAEDSMFLAADYDQVSENVKNALGKNYVDHQDYTLLPGQFKYLPAENLDSKVRYIGVIVHYADADGSQWRKVLKVKSSGKSYHILVHLYAHDVELKQEEE